MGHHGEFTLLIQGAAGILNYHKTFHQSVMDLFPNIGMYFSLSFFLFDSLSAQVGYKLKSMLVCTMTYIFLCFPVKTLALMLYNKDRHWKNTANRRNFFTDFASKRGFDPLVYENWRNVKKKEILQQVQGGSG